MASENSSGRDDDGVSNGNDNGTEVRERGVERGGRGRVGERGT